MAIADDISVATNGDIRWTGAASTTYTVLAFHRFLQDLADDAVASGDDLVDITSDTPSDRSTDNIISLLGSYNIDDELSEHLYDGSISQSGGATVYSGLVVVGSVEDGTELQIIRDNDLLAPFWGSAPTARNADAANNILMRIMVKTRDGDADIDGKKLRVQARELGDAYAEFSLTAGLGNSTAAVFTSADLNNTTGAGTIEGWTTIVNTEGYQLLDIGDGDGVTEEYYSKWDKGSQSINDVYEYTKWISKRALSIDSDTQTGTDRIVDNGTISGTAQLFTNTATAQKLVRCQFDLKKYLAPTGDIVVVLYASDGGSPEAPTGAVLATSNPINCTRVKTTGFNTFTFTFDDNVTLSASTNYFLAVEMAAGHSTDATNYIAVDGSTTTGSGAAENSGGWVGDASAGTTFNVSASPIIHSIAGELFRGISHEIAYNTATGDFTEDEIVYWGADVGYDGIAGGPFVVGEYVTFQPSGGGDVKNAGKVLFQDANNLIVALEDITGSILADNDIITGLTSGATADATASISDDTKAGGEGIVLAHDDNGATGEIYIQLISGSAPSTISIYGRSSSANATSGTVTSRTISPEFIGTSTGSNIIGAYGIGFDVNDITNSDQFFDLTNTLQQPPNNVTFSVTGLIPTEDRVLVAPRAAGIIEFAQFTLTGNYTGAAETGISVTGTIPSDTPTTGVIRVQKDNGVYERVIYSGWDTSTFDISGTQNFSGDAASQGNNAFVGYIDNIAPASSGLSYTAVYSSDRALFVRVRDGGATPIKTFESPATFGNANASIAAIRTSDA
jgi:hypothetical protein